MCHYASIRKSVAEGLHQACGNRSYRAGQAVLPAAQCRPSPTHFPKWPKHRMAATRNAGIHATLLLASSGLARANRVLRPALVRSLMHHKPPEYNSPPAPPPGRSGGTLDLPWTCPIPIEPPQTPGFDQPSLFNSLSRGISAAERFARRQTSGRRMHAAAGSVLQESRMVSGGDESSGER